MSDKQIKGEKYELLMFPFPDGNSSCLTLTRQGKVLLNLHDVSIPWREFFMSDGSCRLADPAPDQDSGVSIPWREFFMSDF